MNISRLILFVAIISVSVFCAKTRDECLASPPYCAYSTNYETARCSDPTPYVSELSCLKTGARNEKYAIVFSVDESGSMSALLREKTVKRIINDMVDHFHNLNELDENYYSMYFWTREGNPYVPSEILWETSNTFLNSKDEYLEKFSPGDTTSLDFGIDPTIKLFDTLISEHTCDDCRRIMIFITDGDGKYTPAGIRDYYGDEADNFSNLTVRSSELYSRNVEVFSIGVNVDSNDVYLVNELAAVTGGASVGSIDLPVGEDFTCNYEDDNGNSMILYYSVAMNALWEKIMVAQIDNINSYITNCITPCPAGYACVGSQKVLCPEGKYSPEGQSTCSRCPYDDDANIGFMYTDTKGSSICRRCPFTYKANSKLSGCDEITSCSGSKMILEPNPYLISKYLFAGGCGDCVTGYYPEDDLRCRLCPAGTEGVKNPAKSQCTSKSTCCSSCSEGQWSEPGSVQGDSYSCAKCVSNLFRDTGNRSDEGCVFCTTYDEDDPNYWTNGNSGSTSCEKCPDEQPYVPNDGADCMSCPTQPPTTFNTTWKACSRTDCTAGYYSFNTSECVECPLDSIAPNAGTQVCEKCPEGLYQNEASETNPIANTVCTERCPAGTLLLDDLDADGNLQCEDCPAGTYQPELDGTTCIPCPVNSYANSTATETCTICADGLGTNGLTGQTSCHSESYWGGVYSGDTQDTTNPLYIFIAVGGAVIIVTALCVFIFYRKKNSNLRKAKADYVFI